MQIFQIQFFHSFSLTSSPSPFSEIAFVCRKMVLLQISSLHKRVHVIHRHAHQRPCVIVLRCSTERFVDVARMLVPFQHDEVKILTHVFARLVHPVRVQPTPDALAAVLRSYIHCAHTSTNHTDAKWGTEKSYSA